MFVIIPTAIVSYRPRSQSLFIYYFQVVLGIYGRILNILYPPSFMVTLPECKPTSECEPVPADNEVEILEPGMNRVVDNSGCCPRVQFLCRVETCPQPPECDKFYELKTNNVSGKCCPEYKCGEDYLSNINLTITLVPSTGLHNTELRIQMSAPYSSPRVS